MTNPEQPSQVSRFNALQKVLIAGGVVGLLFASSRIGCSTEENQAVSTTTTMDIGPGATSTTAPEPYWKKFGWDGPMDADIARKHTREGLAYQNLRTAAGRCVVIFTVATPNVIDPRTQKMSTKKQEGWAIIKNPILDTWEDKGKEVTTFSGVSIIQNHNSAIADDALYAQTFTSVIDGNLLWGSMGIIPNQTQQTDRTVDLSQMKREVVLPRFILPEFQLDDFKEPITLLEYRSNNEPVPGQVVFIPREEDYEVSEHCVLPAHATQNDGKV